MIEDRRIGDQARDVVNTGAMNARAAKGHGLARVGAAPGRWRTADVVSPADGTSART